MVVNGTFGDLRLLQAAVLEEPALDRAPVGQRRLAEPAPAHARTAVARHARLVASWREYRADGPAMSAPPSLKTEKSTGVWLGSVVRQRPNHLRQAPPGLPSATHAWPEPLAREIACDGPTMSV
jgi:hypothetical protein